MEYYKICEVCGQIFTYTDQDIKNNKNAALVSGLAAIGTIVSAVDGSRYDMYEQSKLADRAVSKVVDYNRCPNCGSTNVKLISLDEIKKAEKRKESSKVQISSNATVDSLIKRIKLFIIDNEWADAEHYIHNALDMEPENAELYYLSILVENECENDEELILKEIYISNTRNFKKLMLFADDDLKQRARNIDLEIAYRKSVIEFNTAVNSQNSVAVKTAVENFKGDLISYRDSAEYVKKGENIIFKLEIDEEEARKDKIYNEAIELSKKNKLIDLEHAIKKFETISDFKDSKVHIDSCKEMYSELLEKKRIKEKKHKKIILAVLAIVVICGVGIMVKSMIQQKTATTEYSDAYDKATELFDEGKYKEAIKAYYALNGYEDSKEMILECEYQYLLQAIEQGDDSTAVIYFRKLEDYKDTESVLNQFVKDKIENAISTKNADDLYNYYFAFTRINDEKLPSFVKNQTYIEINSSNSIWKFTDGYLEVSNSDIESRDVEPDINGRLYFEHGGWITIYDLSNYGFTDYYLLDFGENEMHLLMKQ